MKKKTEDTPLQKEIKRYLRNEEGYPREELEDIGHIKIEHLDICRPELTGLSHTCSMIEVGKIDTASIEDYPLMSREVYKETLHEGFNSLIANINTTPRSRISNFFRSLGFKLVHQYKGNEGNVCTYIK